MADRLPLHHKKGLTVWNGTEWVNASADASGVLDVNATVSVTAADGSIVDGVNGAIKATVKDYANSNPVAVVLVDTAGDAYTASGGGGGGGAVTVADGADVVLGATTDASVTGDNTGTVSAKLRGANKVLADVWDSVGHTIGVDDNGTTLSVDDGGGSLTVDGTVAVSGTVPVSGPLTDAQLRATAVPVSGTFYQATQPVSAASLPLPTGAATSAKQDTEIASLASIDGKITAVNTGAVVVSSSALPTGAATAAKQPALGTAGTASADVLTVQGIASMTALKVDGSAVTQPVSDAGGSLTVDGTVAISGTVAVTDNAGSLTVDAPVATPVFVRLSDGAAAISTLPVSLASVPSHAVTNAGTFATQATATGDVAHDGADSGNPVKVGGKAVSSEPTAVAANDRANFITDLVGKLITLPYANPENFVSGAITSAMTGTTSTSLVAAPGAGLRNYITTIIVSNAHATVGTDVVIQDGSGGTTLLTIPAAAVYGGAVINLPVPLRQPTTNTALYCANVTTGASTKVSAVGYKGA